MLLNSVIGWPVFKTRRKFGVNHWLVLTGFVTFREHRIQAMRVGSPFKTDDLVSFDVRMVLKLIIPVCSVNVILCSFQ